jgi:hypothetical protein
LSHVSGRLTAGSNVSPEAIGFIPATSLPSTRVFTQPIPARGENVEDCVIALVYWRYKNRS